MPILSRALLILALLPAATHAAPAANWTRSWAAAPLELVPPPPGSPAAASAPAPLGGDVTIRMNARLSAGGTVLRLRLSNEVGATAVPLGAVHVALADASGAIVPGSDRTVSFGGAARTTIPAWAPIQSDPVSLATKPLDTLIVSIHVPGDASRLAVHPLALSTTLVARGDHAAPDAFPADARRSPIRYLLTGIDVAGGSATGTIVALGDSITDGTQSTSDTDRRWTDVLARRLAARGPMRYSIANVGISGNRLLSMGSGQPALARLDRDVLSVPGAKYLLILEGINDIGGAMRDRTPTPPPATIIAAYRQIIDRAHERGLKVIGATIIPYKGAFYYLPEGETTRKAVNDWIRTPGNFDGVIDFERAVADPADPLRMAPAYDSGDRLHPGDAGYRRMGEAIDLRLFK